MVVDTWRKLQDDGNSDGRSPGSNYHPSSQSRKVSIGILIDPLANKRYGAREMGKAAPNEEMETPRKATSEGEKDKGEDVGRTKGKISDAPQQIASPWITTKSANQTSLKSEKVPNGKEASRLASAGGSKRKLSNKKDPSLTHSVKFFANQSSIGPSDDGKEKLFKGLTYTRKGLNSESSQREQDFAFPTAHDVPTSDKAKAGNIAVPKTDTLRMKLWEVLGTVSSPKSQPSNPKGHDLGVSSSKPEKITDGSNADPNIRYKQNSHPIEIDPESPAHSMKRPFRPASIRKRVSPKRQPLKPKTNPFTTLNGFEKVQRKDVFTFKEGLADKGDVAVNGNLCTSTGSGRKNQRKTANIMPRKISFISNSHSDNFEGSIQTSDVPASTAKTSSHMSKMGSLKSNVQAQKVGSQDKTSHQSQRECSHQSVRQPGLNMNEGFIHPTVPKDGDQSQDFGRDSPLSKTESPQDNMGSITLKLNSPVSSPYHSSPKAEQPVKEVHSPARSERSSPVGNIFHFMTFGASKPGGSVASSETDESEDDGAGMKDSPEVQSSPEKVGTGGSRSSQSLSEDENLESSDDGSPVASGQTRTPNTETGASGRSDFNPTKRLHTEERVRKPSSSLSSPKGFDDHEWTPEPGEHGSGDDDSERVVMLFALALENYVKKVKSATLSKSSEIMKAVSIEIHQQLENIKLRIQEDVVNLTSISTSKRKRVESSFREQAEQLKTIHEKFEQDIHQCLQNYKVTLEGLESYQNELKGTMKKQKAIHQKNLMQAEETVEKLLLDAQRRIEGVQKMEREKIVQLRYIVAECMKDGSST